MDNNENKNENEIKEQDLITISKYLQLISIEFNDHLSKYQHLFSNVS